MPPASSSADWPPAAAGTTVAPPAPGASAGDGSSVLPAAAEPGRYVPAGTYETGRPASGVAGRVRPASVAGGRVRGGCVRAGRRRTVRARLAVFRPRGERVGVHVHDHLIAVAGRALVEPAGQRRLGHHPQRIRPPLRQRRRHAAGRVICGIPGRTVRPRLAPLGVERRVQRPPHGGAHLGRQPAAHHHHPVLVHPGRERPRGVPLRVLRRLGRAVDPPPRADYLLDVRRGAGQRHVEQRLLGLGRGHAGDGAHLRVGDGAAPQRVAQPGQPAQGAGDPHVLAGGAGRQAGAPAQPLGAGGEAGPAVARVELAEQAQQLAGGRLDAGGQLGDAVAEHVEAGCGLVPAFRQGSGRPGRGGNRWRRNRRNGRSEAGVSRHESIITPIISTACTAPGRPIGRPGDFFHAAARAGPPERDQGGGRGKPRGRPNPRQLTSTEAVKQKNAGGLKKVARPRRGNADSGSGDGCCLRRPCTSPPRPAD